MGRARGQRSGAGAASGRFDSLVGARRGVLRDPLLSPVLTDAARAQSAPVLDAVEQGRLRPALEMLHMHATDIDRAPALAAVRNAVVKRMTENTLARLLPAMRPSLAAVGAGPSASLHVVRCGERLHILPGGVLAVEEDQSGQVTCARAACGDTLLSAQQALTGDWAAAPAQYAPGAAYLDFDGEERAHPGPAAHCEGCAAHADSYPECGALDDTAPEDELPLRTEVSEHMRELLHRHLLDDTGTSPAPDCPSADILGAESLRAGAPGIERALAAWCSQGGFERLGHVLGGAHATYYARELAKARGLHRDASQDELVRLAAGCWQDLLSWRDNTFGGLAHANPVYRHVEMRKLLRERVGRAAEPKRA